LFTIRIGINHRSRDNYSINRCLRDFEWLIENSRVKVSKPQLIMNNLSD
jgi:hypothetical protein